MSANEAVLTTILACGMTSLLANELIALQQLITRILFYYHDFWLPSPPSQSDAHES